MFFIFCNPICDFHKLFCFRKETYYNTYYFHLQFILRPKFLFCYYCRILPFRSKGVKSNCTQVRCSKCYVIKYFEGSNAVKTTSMRKQKTTPFFCSHVMFESIKFLLLIRRKELIEPKKVSQPAKKGFCMFFFAVCHPLCDI